MTLDYHDGVYCYPDTDVLINHYDLKDPEKLKQLERVLTAVRLIDLYKKPLAGRFDFAHLKAIHHYIFQDIYPWAGRVRTVNIAKGLYFCQATYIEQEGRRIFESLKKEHYLHQTPYEKLHKRTAWYLSEINALHPFRDGNGRAQREFMRELLLPMGITLDLTAADPKLMLEASIASFQGDLSLMEELMQKCLQFPASEQINH